ncbi:sec1 family protein, partial [Cystoisospora suis]
PLHDRSKKRLIVFILGGITHAEMRSAYEVSKDLHADVFLGGSCILTPPEIIKLLRASLVSLSKKEKEEDEEEEEEEPA